MSIILSAVKRNFTPNQRDLSRIHSRSNTFSGISEVKRSDGVERKSSFEQPSHSTRPTTVNVVLFGETGVGKSSVINLIARRQLAKVSSDVNGCTMQSTRYEIPFDGMTFAIFDTIGLEEPQIAVNGYFKAIEKAYQLIEELSAAGGIHLLLFCMRGGRITATTQSNYRLFHEALCSKSVPIALVFTGLEREVEMENWWERNEKHILDYGIRSSGHACITAVQDDTPGEDLKYTESQRKIRELLKTCALKDDAFLLDRETWIARLGHFMRNFIKKHKVPAKKDMLRVLMKRCKLDPETAKRIVEIMEKSGAKSEDGQAATDKIEATTDPAGQVDERGQDNHKGDEERRTDQSDGNDSGPAVKEDREGSQTPTGRRDNAKDPHHIQPEGGGSGRPMVSGNRGPQSQAPGKQVVSEQTKVRETYDKGRKRDGRGRRERNFLDEHESDWTNVDGREGSTHDADDEAASGYQTAPDTWAEDEPPVGWRGGSQAIQGRREFRSSPTLSVLKQIDSAGDNTRQKLATPPKVMAYAGMPAR